jgi:anti-sigma factor RsiW
MTEDVHGPVEDAFSALVDGELSPERKQAVEAHLAGCARCRAGLERFRATVGGLGSLRERAPSTFLPDIQRQIYTRSRGRFFARRWVLFGRIPFEWVSLVMIIAMLVYYLVSQHASPTHVTPGP